MTRNAAEVDTTHGPGPAARPVSPAREIAPAWAGLVLFAGLAWLIVVRQSAEMDAGAGTMGISPALFLAMWLAMTRPASISACFFVSQRAPSDFAAKVCGAGTSLLPRSGSG